MVGNCHCRDCQRVSGSPMISSLFFPTESTEINGSVRYFDALADSGNRFSRGFCPNCGSSLFGRSSGLPHLIAIRVLALENPEAYRPRVNIFTDSAPSWHVFDDAIPKFSRGP